MGFTLGTCAMIHASSVSNRRELGSLERSYSAAQAETIDQRLVACRIRLLQIVEQLAALIDHLEQSPTGVMVARVRGEVLGEPFDACRQQGYLDLRRTRVVCAAAVFGDDSGLLLGR